MRLYNTLTRSIEDIQPQQPPHVTIYTCGPTVYDYPHVGNWFTFIRYDLLVRALKASDLQPTWVMNITDVGHLTSDADEGEDKLEKGAIREGKTAQEIAEFYGDYFIKGLTRLHFSKPDYLPKATEHIPEQIALIKQLEDKGYTYRISDGVYYDTAKFPRYADFAKLDIDEQQAGARVEVNPEKHNPTDFALWKLSPTDSTRDMEWDSPWGKGFPGWHIECSAMSMKYLGETLDVHSGGIDHLPVHHTNEIAQSEAATGKVFAKYWMHTNHVFVEGEKISKSLNNGITLEDIEAKGFSLEAFRLLVLESHYRTQSKFSWENLEAAQNRLRDIYAWADLKYQASDEPMTSDLDKLFSETKQAILGAITEDLNTPVALASLSTLIAQTTTPSIEKKHWDEMLPFISDLLGLELANRSDISEEQKHLIDEREKARTTQDWTTSDTLRDTLKQQGIGLRDSDQRAIWYRL